MTLEEIVESVCRKSIIQSFEAIADQRTYREVQEDDQLDWDRLCEISKSLEPEYSI